MRGQGFRARGLAASELVLGVGQLLQRGVPLGFQTPGDQPVVRVDGPVATLGLAGLVAGLLDLAAPLRERGVVTVLELLGGGQAGLQRGGLQRGQEGGGYGGVDRDAADAQVPGCRGPRRAEVQRAQTMASAASSPGVTEIRIPVGR